MATADDFRIERIQRGVSEGGDPIKCFMAFQRSGDTFRPLGYFDAPGDTPDEDLWQHVKPDGDEA